jgi:hypothetical protein
MKKLISAPAKTSDKEKILDRLIRKSDKNSLLTGTTKKHEARQRHGKLFTRALSVRVGYVEIIFEK